MVRCRDQWPLCCQTVLTKTRSHHCNVPSNPCASTNQQCTSNVLWAPAPNQQMIGNLVSVVHLEGWQPLIWLKFAPLTIPSAQHQAALKGRKSRVNPMQRKSWNQFKGNDSPSLRYVKQVSRKRKDHRLEKYRSKFLISEVTTL